MLSWREIASQICSSLTKPCSISTRPRRRPVFFCCSSDTLSCSCEITLCATSVSPSLIFSGRPIDSLASPTRLSHLLSSPDESLRLPGRSPGQADQLSAPVRELLGVHRRGRSQYRRDRRR